MIYALKYKGDDAGKDAVRLSDYAARNINNEIRRVPGVGKVMYSVPKRRCGCGSIHRNCWATACPWPM